MRSTSNPKGRPNRVASLSSLLSCDTCGRFLFFSLALVALFTLAGCGIEPTPVAVATNTATATLTSPPPTSTPSPTSTTVPTSTPTPSPTHTSTATPTPTQTPTPTPFPGASLVAFETYRDGNAEVYLLDTTSGETTNLTRHPADDRVPAWRPDGQAIAFESNREGNWDIYLLSFVDGSVTRLTEDPAFDGAPVWSPDGTEIAFESYRDGDLEIYVTMPGDDGNQPRRLTADPAGDYGPAWSPDGGQIAFTSWRDGNQEVYVVPSAGGDPRNLTDNPADDQDPAWLPGGDGLAFVSWRDVDDKTGNRNAEIYQVSTVDGSQERLTDNPWPDLDPAWDAEGRLVWASYEPGPPFETYDPFRPGDYHIYRTGADGPTALTGTNWDDRRPAPGPALIPSLAGLQEKLPAKPDPLPAEPTLSPGSQAEVIPVPSILASFGEQPILVNELVAPSLEVWQRDIVETSGWDFLAGTLGSWRSIGQQRSREMYAYDYGYLSWHKAGRALDLALEYKVEGSDQMLLVREDLGSNVYWRMYLRTAKQDGTQGEPLKANPWLYWWHIVPDHDPDAYAAGGKRRPIPSGYYADITALAKSHGWERIACYAIDDDYHWRVDSNGTEYWHYERTDGLIWWDAMSQLYTPDLLDDNVGWQAGLQNAQSEEMMISKGVPTPSP